MPWLFDAIWKPFAKRCLPNWVEESSLVILTILCWYFMIFSPPAISPLISKKLNASPPALGCPCEPALRRYQQEWPVQYHKPITRSGQPRAGRVARGRSTRSLGKPKLQAAQPNASGNQLHPTPATMSREYPAHLQAAAPEAPMRHSPMRPHDPRPNTKESSLQSISPMFGSAVQERAMAGVTQGRKSCSCMPVDGNTLAQDPSRMTQGRNITGVPGLAWCRLLLWPGEFG